jgi:type IV secretory pathway VirB10-like protein
MTDGEFQTQLVRLSPKIQASLAKPEGESVKTTLPSLVMTATGTADLETALSVLKADPAKLAVLEDQIAARVAAAPVAVQPQAVPAPPSSAQLSPMPPPTPTVTSAAVVPPAAPGAVREYMWVAPAVSGAVILGFFVMLWILLNQQVHPTSATVTDVAAKMAAATDERAATAADTDKQAAAKKLAEAKAASSQTAAAVDAAKKDAETKDASAKDAAAKAAAQFSGNASPSGLQNVLFTLLGALSAAFTQVVNFWLGSSKGSSDKTALLAAANPVPGAK